MTLAPSKTSLLVGGAALFMGAVLTFWLQPMVGRLLLPEYGGAASVWVVCLAAFQVLLLVGYGYAYGLAHLPVRIQRVVHLLVLAAAAAWSWRGGNPCGVSAAGTVAPAVLSDILRLAGLPFAAVAAGSTLLQNWLARGRSDRNVYRLYALSNAGSFAGLLLYPLLLEPLTSVHVQRFGWNTCLLLYAVAVTMTAAFKPARPDESHATPDPATPQAAQPDGARAIQRHSHAPWFWLPCLSSALLVAITAHVTQQIIALPLVWAMILGAFLLSYTLGFSPHTERTLRGWRTACLLVVAMSPLAFLRHPSLGVALTVILYGTLLMAVAGIWLHGWLFASRPEASHLPRFYLCLAAGGALGGATTSLLPPACFRGMWEFPLLLGGLAFVALRQDLAAHGRTTGVARRALWVGVGAAMLWGFTHELRPSSGTVHQARDFYGHISVWQGEVATKGGRQGILRELNHGAVCHGQQYMLPGWRSRPLAYFGPASGVALAIESHPKRMAIQPMRVGVVGLGIGSIAAYGRTGDEYVLYEISRVVLDVATNRSWFTYLDDCSATVTLKLGDGRKLIEQEVVDGEPLYDVLVLDAFAGDSPPLHLLTREAFELYMQRLTTDGILAMNISNWHIDFLPLCKAIAAELHLDVQAFQDPGRPDQLLRASAWVLFSRTPRDYHPQQEVRAGDWTRVRDTAAPTDDRGSALRYLAIGRGAGGAFK